jgi:predicted MPP superfamily phosphohydrolase
VNAQHPDLILLAGDFVGSRRVANRYYTFTQYSYAEIAAPLGRLRAPLGVYAVLGNHDYWRSGAHMKAALERAGIRVLVNEVLRAGPVTLAGADDEHTERADIGRIARAASGMPDPLLLFTHSPDLVPRLPPQFALVLAGHTHCGQIVLPLIGALASSSRYGERYRCGVIHEGKRTIIVASGLGASVLPFRLGAPPDWWMVTLGR